VPWLPTTEDFLAVTGLPIQLARALCAVLVAVAFVMLLRRSSHRADTALRRVVNTLDGFVYRCRNDRHWRMVSVTDGVLALTGYAPEAFLPPAEVHYGQLIHPEDVDSVWAEVQAASVARRDFHLTYRMVTRGGEVRWVRERGRGIHGADGRLECLEGHIIDDTVRHEAMEELTRTTRALRDSEARLNEAQRMARVGNWELDLASGRLAWSEEIFRIFELDPGRFDASYQAFLDAIHPDDRERVDAAYSRSLEDRSPYVISHRLCMPDGRVKWVEERCVTDFDADGRPRVSRGTVQDITERHDIEEELRQFRATLDHTLDCVFMVEPATLRFTYVNRGAMDQLGYGRDELLRMHPMDINPDFDEARLRALVAPLETGSREHLTFETRPPLRRPPHSGGGVCTVHS